MYPATQEAGEPGQKTRHPSARYLVGEHRIQGSLRNVEMLATIPPGSRDRGSPTGAAGPDQGFLRTVAVRSGRAEEVPEELRGALLELGRGDPMMVGGKVWYVC